MAWWVELSEIVRNFGLLGAAVIGVVLAGMRVFAANWQADASLRQAELTRRTHVADLFNRAIEQLDHDKMEVRLAAIHTLRQLGADFPDPLRFGGRAFAGLLYQREGSPLWGCRAASRRQRDRQVGAGAAEGAAMTARHDRERRTERPLNFGGLFLRRVDLTETDLQSARMAEADFAHADLSGSDLTNADLSRASFQHARMRGAILQDALLDGTDFRGADLTDVRGLVPEQLAGAVIDSTTRLPVGLGGATSDHRAQDG